MPEVPGRASLARLVMPVWPVVPRSIVSRPARGELDGQKAFTQGKVKITGKMLKMMQLRGPLAQVQAALATIDTEY